MKNKALAALLGALILSVVAYAATPRTRAIEHVSPEKFKNLIVEPAGYAAWDFPALGDGFNLLQLPCDETAAITTVGARIADSCTVGSDLGVDGGSRLLSTAQLTCECSTDVTYVKLCVTLTDGGTYNLHDAGFFTRCSR